ncbi:MAG TPA: DNA-processing protein DprA [Candidatus Paceibacterota bacterium]
MERKVLKPESYPALLKEIPKLPKELYIIGEIPQEESLFLGIVGTRKFSHYGKEACEKIIEELARYLGEALVIVSGLALGIDAIAHQAALDNHLKTIAIPGSGLDSSVLHPRSNHSLAKKIVEKGGALLSEFPWDYPASVHTFPQRNRIIAGISQGVLVIEAPKESGALITANYALEFNRDVFAVPGSIFNENSIGTNNLIKSGAVPVTSGEDILSAFNIPVETEEKNLFLNLSPIEKQVIEALSEPIERDELIRLLAMPVGEISPVLTSMEMNGLIKESGGEFYKAS